MTFVLPAPILPTDEPTLRQRVQAHLDNLTKPRGSLGRLEEFALRFCMCRGDIRARCERLELFTFAADHGITLEGITPFPREVTAQMVLNMAHGGAAVSVMCRRAGIGYQVIDIGVDHGFPSLPGLLVRKVARGTRSFRSQPAMTLEECTAALQVGVDLAQASNADMLGLGEMGIGNTSSASALYSLLLDLSADQTVGPGTGAQGALLEKKKAVITDALRLHRTAWDGTALDALCRVGGLEIAGMAGMMLGAASRRIPVVVDGFIAGAAALVALRMDAAVCDYLFFSHASAEPFHAPFLAKEGIIPILDLGMRLGEGTGAVLGMQIISQSMACYNEMATFDSAGVSGES